MTRPAALLVALAVVPLLAACGGSPVEIGPRGVDELKIPTPSADPDDYVEGITNPFLPLTPGSRWVYESDGDEPETITVTVTDETRLVQGVTTTVVHDQATGPDGEVIEDTYDWFAQDAAGNVWYFGEETVEYDEDGSEDTGGSWEAGVDGAQAGIAMLAIPRVGDGYQQEFLEGEAEDRASVISLDESVILDLGTYDGVLLTEDSTPLEPDQLERKYYAPGVGVVLEQSLHTSETVRLVEYTEG